MLPINDNIDQKTTENRLIKLELFASIGRLSVSLVHELSNPLDGISRYMRLLLDQFSEDDPKRMYAERVQEGLMRMARMVRGLLEFTRQSMSKSSPIDIQYVVKQTLFLFSSQISQQNITVETEFDKGMPIVLNTDVSHVFTNIIKNAIQAMPNGGTLSIKAKMLSPLLSEFRFSDTGTGIPDEIRERIFEPFFTTKDPGECVGLGLFLCREIVESYKGSIHIESDLNKGTTFIVRLPMSKGKILVMDDEKYIRDTAGDMLSRLGYRVTTAIDGAEAIELYKEAKDFGQPYDAVIMDLVVPGGINGEEAIKKLIEYDPEIKAIASSGYPHDPIMVNFSEYGFKGAIAKPYKLEELSVLLDDSMKDY